MIALLGDRTRSSPRPPPSAASRRSPRTPTADALRSALEVAMRRHAERDAAHRAGRPARARARAAGDDRARQGHPHGAPRARRARGVRVPARATRVPGAGRSSQSPATSPNAASSCPSTPKPPLVAHGLGERLEGRNILRPGAEPTAARACGAQLAMRLLGDREARRPARRSAAASTLGRQGRRRRPARRRATAGASGRSRKRWATSTREAPARSAASA